MASGLAEPEGRRVVQIRQSGNGTPYDSVEDLARRTGISRKALEALAAADAFASLKVTRRNALWDAKAVEQNVPLLLRLAALLG